MRLFLAIDLPGPVKENLERELTEIKREYPQFSWVSPENYHITVHFFGETDKVEKIKKKTEDLLYDQESFYLYATSAGLFINSKIVIYLNFRKERKLESLVKKIKEGFDHEFQNKKKFVSHLTLARCRIPSKQQYFVLKKRLEKIEMDLSFPVNKITLFQSVLGGKKPTYNKLAEFKLLP